jgi:hypothetical protein
MTSTTRIITITLVLLALTAPVAGAMPVRDVSAPTAAPHQDVRNADDGGLTPLVFILPSLALVAMLGAAVIYTRSSRPARV